MSDIRSNMLPPGLRVQAYALIDLLLTLIEVAQSETDPDFDSTLIRLVIVEATIHPLLTGAPTEMLNWPELPESVLGSISRVLIAERANLPRETVRRKANALISADQVEEAGHGMLRADSRLTDAATRARVNAGVAAVKKCLARIEAAARMNEPPRRVIR